MTLFVTKRNKKMLCAVSSSGMGSERGLLEGYQVPFGEGIVGYVAATGQLLRFPTEGGSLSLDLEGGEDMR